MFRACSSDSRVQRIGLEHNSDVLLWDYARRHGLVLVSKDDDFRDLQLLRGQPPKLIVIRMGNARNAAVLEALLNAADRIDSALQQDDVGILELF